MKLDSKLFDRIRVKPPESDVVDEDGPRCAWKGCDRQGTHRAPMGRVREGQYFHFCLDHVRDYNKTYNYFAGMAPADIDAYQKASITGHRPTWAMGVNPEAERRGHSPGRGWNTHFRDTFGFFGGDPPGARPSEATSEHRQLRNVERRSFAVLDLEGRESKPEIKARFKELVKRHHPDANGGDRSSEDRLREIIQAYNHLKAAGFC